MGGRGSWRVRGLGFRGVPEIRGTFLGGVPAVVIIKCWGLGAGPPTYGTYHVITQSSRL